MIFLNTANAWYDFGFVWFADYYLLATLLLTAVFIATLVVRQPARRLAIAWAAAGGLMMLALLVGLPGWSVVHLLSSPSPPPARFIESSTVVVSAEPSPPPRPSDFELLPTYPIETASEPTVVVSPYVAVIAAPVREVNLIPYFLLPLLAGSSAMLVWLGLGAWQTSRLVRGSTAAPREVNSLLESLSKNTTHRPTLRLSERVGTGVALGLRRPTILLPQTYADRHDAVSLRSVLAHELAHVQNGDLWLLATLRVLQIILWAHPLYWLVRRRVRLDQETLADAAAAEITSRETYAEQLVGWARDHRTPRPPTFAGAVGLWETRSQLRKRITLLLDHRLTILRDCSRRWKLSAVGLCAVVAVGLSLVTMEPGESVAEAAVGDVAASPNNIRRAADATQGAEDNVDGNASQDAVDGLGSTIHGTATNTRDEPVEGAKVYLVSTNGIRKPLGESTTDATGNYEFRDVQIPVRKRDDAKRSGTIQVYGIADGYAFSWHGMRHVVEGDRPPQPPGIVLQDSGDFRLFADDDKKMDLRFLPAAALKGRIVDEHGQPVKDVKLTLGNCDYLDTDSREDHHNFREFWCLSQISEKHRVATTNDHGEFSLVGLPPDTVSWISVRHPDFANMSFYAATTGRPIREWDDHPVRTGLLDLTLVSTRVVNLRVDRGPDGDPVAGIRVHAYQQRASGPAASGITDEEGSVILRLPPGNYKVSADPQTGVETIFVRTKGKLAVTTSPATQSYTLRMEKGCELLLRCVFIDTDKGVPGVSFWYMSDDGRRRYGVQSNTYFIDHPKTNENGVLRAVVYPGKRKYGIGWNPLPDGYEVVGLKESEIELSAGEKVEQWFFVRKKNAEGKKDEGAEDNVGPDAANAEPAHDEDPENVPRAETQPKETAYFFAVPVTTALQKTLLGDETVVAYVSVDAIKLSLPGELIPGAKNALLKPIRERVKAIADEQPAGTLRVNLDFGTFRPGQFAERQLLDTFREIGDTAGFAKTIAQGTWSNNDDYKWKSFVHDGNQEGNEKAIHVGRSKVFPVATPLSKRLSGGVDCYIEIDGLVPLDAAELLSADDLSALQRALAKTQLAERPVVKVRVRLAQPDGRNDIRELPHFQKFSLLHRDLVNTLLKAGFTEVRLVLQAGPTAMNFSYDRPLDVVTLPPPFNDYTIVIAKHMMLLDGKKVITWPELENKIVSLKDTSKVRLHYYMTRGAREAGHEEFWRAEHRRLQEKFGFSGYSIGGLHARNEFRYDQIETAADLLDDPSHAVTGQVVDASGNAVGGAEILLIEPVDESISYKAISMAFVDGKVRNRLEHVMTLSDEKGQFTVYPSSDDVKHYLLALHPDAGFAVVQRKGREQVEPLKLAPWASLQANILPQKGYEQSASISSSVPAIDGWPEISISHYAVDRREKLPAGEFRFPCVPPKLKSIFRRSIQEANGSSVGLPTRELNLKPGEKMKLEISEFSDVEKRHLRLHERFKRERGE